MKKILLIVLLVLVIMNLIMLLVTPRNTKAAQPKIEYETWEEYLQNEFPDTQNWFRFREDD